MPIPLGELPRRIDEVPGDRPIVVYCGAGERSSSAASLLERGGRTRVLNLSGGLSEWRRLSRGAAR
jgi:rhodanese-related sulfurtransferase